MDKILHITNWYPNRWNQNEAGFIKEHFDACKKYVEQELWHVQVRNEGALFRLYLGDYSENEHYIVLDTRVRIWRLQEILTFLLLVILRVKLGKKWWDVADVHIAYPLLRFTKIFRYLFGRSVVITEHWSAYRNNFFLPYMNKAAKRIAKIFSYEIPVIAVSRALMGDIVQFAGHDNFPQHIIPNVVDPATFYPEIHARNNALIFLMVASWAPIKRPFLVMKAFVELLHDLPEAKLRIVGSGAQFSEMREFVLDNRLENSIELLGAMDKAGIGREMRQADCFLHASEYETFSVVCAEALSCGLPVIASNVGGIPEFVNSKNGILVENTHEDWISALRKFVDYGIKFEREEIVLRNKEKFDPYVIGKKLEHIYELSIMGLSE